MDAGNTDYILFSRVLSLIYLKALREEQVQWTNDIKNVIIPHLSNT